MIAPTPFFADRGCHVQIYEEAKALKKLGNKVTIATYHIGRDVPGVKIYRCLNIPWYKKLEAGPSLHKLYIDPLLFFTSLRIAIREKPDIIHGHLHEGALIGYFVSRIMRKPLLFDLQDSLTGELRAYKYRDTGAFYKLLFFAEKWIDHRADIIVTQSSDMMDELEKKFKIPKRKLALTMDGADVKTFRPGLNTNGIDIKLPKGKTIVAYLGGLTKNKGVDYLIKAIPHVIKKNKNVHFLVMGYPNVEYYKTLAKKIGVEEYVTFTGKIEYSKAPQYLNLADIAVSPKCTETEANGKLYNYMAVGLPVVAFDTRMDREVLGNSALYAGKKDVKDLARNILKFVNNKTLAKKSGKALRKRVVENYSWDRVGGRLMKSYRAITS